jgi:hypothetical protein
MHRIVAQAAVPLEVPGFPETKLDNSGQRYIDLILGLWTTGEEEPTTKREPRRT